MYLLKKSLDTSLNEQSLFKQGKAFRAKQHSGVKMVDDVSLSTVGRAVFITRKTGKGMQTLPDGGTWVFA
jgi:hypothetical protein